jgi:hypothetical protein
MTAWKERITMRQPQEAIEFEEFLANAPAIFEEIERRHGGIVVRREGKLYLLRPKAARRSKRRGFSENDSIFELVGKGKSAEPTDVRLHKDEYLAEAHSGKTAE